MANGPPDEELVGLLKGIIGKDGAFLHSVLIALSAVFAATITALSVHSHLARVQPRLCERFRSLPIDL